MGRSFRRMNCEIDAASGERFFNFFGENPYSALGADFGEGDVSDFVAGGLDDFDFDCVAARAKESGDVVGLPESELGAAGADAETRHQLAASLDSFFLDALLPVDSVLTSLDRRVLDPASCRAD